MPLLAEVSFETTLIFDTWPVLYWYAFVLGWL